MSTRPRTPGHGAPAPGKLPITDLIYDIVLGDARYEVHGPASVFIPAGLPHSANVRAGTGFFVAIVLGVQEYDTAFGEG